MLRVRLRRRIQEGTRKTRLTTSERELTDHECHKRAHRIGSNQETRKTRLTTSEREKCDHRDFGDSINSLGIYINCEASFRYT